MSAVPKKKLCWNCEGNVSKQIDNCPYCGVYLHSMESEEENLWNPSYRSSPNDEEDVPVPPYQASSTGPESSSSTDDSLEQTDSIKIFSGLLDQIKKDILPVLLLMGGSLFFLFGTILFLFADQDGTLTLRWKADLWIYFLAISLPSIYFGWSFLQQIDNDKEN
jgi:hypothetical protein